jgi:hypothetical protein
MATRLTPAADRLLTTTARWNARGDKHPQDRGNESGCITMTPQAKVSLTQTGLPVSLLLGVVVALISPYAPATGVKTLTGVRGTVSVSPVIPGAQHPGEPSTAPLAGTEVRLFTRTGEVAGSAITSANGHFAIDASAGEYEVRAMVHGPLPRCRPEAVTIRSGQVTDVDIGCDSGIR